MVVVVGVFAKLGDVEAGRDDAEEWSWPLMLIGCLGECQAGRGKCIGTYFKAGAATQIM